MSLWKPAAPFLNGCYFDLLIDIPPFNDKNIFIQHNILVVNENGDCIMTAVENTGAVNVCSIFNKILRHSNIPIQQKTVKMLTIRVFRPNLNFPPTFMRSSNQPSMTLPINHTK